MKPLRIAVVGVGRMGYRHAEKVAALRDAEGTLELAGVADVRPERANRAAAAFGTRAVSDGRALFDAADAAIVAVPTSAHFEVAQAALERGLDVLVEKPITTTVAEAEALFASARARGRVLQVGHLEWFNAAMRVMRERIDAPRYVEAQRLGPFPARTTDVDVVRDLMIHDIDILQGLLGEEPDRIEAIGVPVVSDQADIANARLSFPCRCVANLTASRVSPTPLRKLRLFQRDAYVSIDFLAPSAAIFRRCQTRGDGLPRLEMEELKIDREDTLLTQLRAFLEAVHTRRRPERAGEAAIGALRTALRVVEAMPSPVDRL